MLQRQSRCFRDEKSVREQNGCHEATKVGDIDGHCHMDCIIRAPMSEARGYCRDSIGTQFNSTGIMPVPFTGYKMDGQD